MALVVQSDEGDVTGANSYISYEYFEEYLADRNVDIGTPADEVVEAALIRATEYIDNRFRFVSRRLDPEQTTAWPREYAYNLDGDHVEGIPTVIKYATAEYALVVVQGGALWTTPTTVADPSGRLVEEKEQRVGSLLERTKYAVAYGVPYLQFPVADNILSSSGFLMSAKRRAVRN